MPPPIGQCFASGCAATELRRCYLCPNLCCADHGTISASGTICAECSARERSKQEAAAARGSGCLLAVIGSLAALACIAVRALRRSR